jgi:hypothetical protein
MIAEKSTTDASGGCAVAQAVNDGRAGREPLISEL